MSKDEQERLERLERIVLAIAKKTGVALNWETLCDLDRRLSKAGENT